MKETTLGKWIEEDKRKKAIADFKGKLKYGKLYNTTTLAPGQRITVKNGRIIVQ
jgi:hypothetical protein